MARRWLRIQLIGPIRRFDDDRCDEYATFILRGIRDDGFMFAEVDAANIEGRDEAMKYLRPRLNSHLSDPVPCVLPIPQYVLYAPENWNGWEEVR